MGTRFWKEMWLFKFVKGHSTDFILKYQFTHSEHYSAYQTAVSCPLWPWGELDHVLKSNPDNVKVISSESPFLWCGEHKLITESLHEV